MEREKIVERDFMGLIDADGVAENKNDPKDGLTKDPNTDATVEDGSCNSLSSNKASRHLVTSATYASGLTEGLSSSVPPVDDHGSFPSRNLSLSFQNFRQHLGSHAILKGQQVASSPFVASSMASPTSIQYSFPPYAGSYPNSTATSKSITIPGNPPCAQLTIFYSGTVNVYDDVPADKAQGLMLLAACARSTKMTNVPPRSPAMSMAMANGCQSPIPSTFSPNFPNRALPATVQASLQKPHGSVQLNPSAAVSLNAGDSQTNHSIGISSSQLEASKSSAPVISPTPVVPQAVPQARKASLARFLEKRKERIVIKAPYPSKKSPDGSPQREQSPNSIHASAPLDGCLTKDHQMTTSGLDNKICVGSESRESFLEKGQQHSYIEKAPKTEKEENEIAI